MKLESAKHFIDKFPDFLEFSVKYFSSNIQKNGQEIFDSASGTIGIIVKLLGKPMVDKYFESLDAKILQNHGFKTYIESAYEQVEKSLNKVKITEKSPIEYKDLEKIVKNSLTQQIIGLSNKNLISAFHPKNHPSVEFVRSNITKLLTDLQFEQGNIDSFIADYNKNIESTIQNKFGTNYQKHLDETKLDIMEESEYEFLVMTKDLMKIGFTEGEDLEYMETFAKWEKVTNYRKTDEENQRLINIKENKNEIDDMESQLQPIGNLISQYFQFKNKLNCLNKILFIVSDFGKGKSVFMKHFASKLAINYLKTNSGPFPVYFNLKNYNQFKSGNKLGVLFDYLSYHNINIESDYYKRKEYIFLVDSLDESGELNSENIAKIIDDVKLIQHLDKETCRENKILITSRPIDEGLESQLKLHEPFEKAGQGNRMDPYFISLYGFKKSQFNTWLHNSLKNKPESSLNVKLTGYPLEIMRKSQNDETIDFYSDFTNKSILTYSELRRPIFAYMIYQLIINNVDFRKIGKIGIYLSFINLLSKEAKYVKDGNYELNLAEEFKSRNILHSIAALWQFERIRGKSLTKVNICKTIEARNLQDSDDVILNRYKKIRDLQFLSHSYFGESGKNLNFQHQSFAEILLAEYYLKIFIKYAFDYPKDTETARKKLSLGIPTEQTMVFLIQLMNIFTDCADDDNSIENIEKRKLLLPLMASLATIDYCKDLYSNHIAPWYTKYFLADDTLNQIPQRALEDWCFKKKDIVKISELCKDILDSDLIYCIAKTRSYTNLYDNEIVAIEDFGNSSKPIINNLDKWIALVVGNVTYTSKDEELFNSTIQRCSLLFDMIQDWNYAYKKSSPAWASSYFQGIKMSIQSNEIDLSNLNLSRLDFTNSILSNITAFNSDLSYCKFDRVRFSDVDFSLCNLSHATFDNFSIFKDSFFSIRGSSIFGIQLPKLITEGFENIFAWKRIITFGYIRTSYFPLLSNNDKMRIDILKDDFGLDFLKMFFETIFVTLKGILKYLRDNGKLRKENAMDLFDVENTNAKQIIQDFIDDVWNNSTKNEHVELN